MLKILHNSQENTCVRLSFFIKLEVTGLWHRVSPVNLALQLYWNHTSAWVFILRTPCSKNTPGKLLLVLTPLYENIKGLKTNTLHIRKIFGILCFAKSKNCIIRNFIMDITAHKKLYFWLLLWNFWKYQK